ncbi:ABC transporter transmembrane region domain-containing protein [Phthorimaea operculella]|nr:ABC transporter transmembrane region domain-containing protein [Phthorimaea operculella]
MIDYEKRGLSDEKFLAHIQEFAIKGVSVGVIVFIGTYMGSAFMNITAINQIFKIRQEYLKSILNQDFSYFDTRQIGDFASKTSENVIKLEEGIGDKLSAMVFYVTCGLSSVIMALVKGWKLALICLISAPVSFLLVGLTGKFAQRLSKKEAEESGRASAIAEEVLSSIQTVFAFNGQQKELERYSAPLAAARKTDIKKELFTGLTMSLLFVCIFSSYGLAFYFGVYLIVHEPKNYNAEVMFSVFIGVISGLQYLGMLGMLVTSFASARGAGASIFHLLDSVPTINPLLDRGLTPKAVEGRIEFQDVVFRYPARPDIIVLNGFNLVVNRGQIAALVGHSGCGKSTAIQLVCRYYDVIFDGHDVRSLSVRWLRAQVGLVGQEPVLFNTTVRENIRYGREDASNEDIEAAARQANAHHFIHKLPKGYDTLVGERGAALSGGQKQRIAIARALLRNPQVLLLDEATSALDSASEAKVQKALDAAAKGRTTLIVAHRLSTIRHVDIIYVVSDGKVVEQGSHEDLMKKKGSYYEMVKLQQPTDFEEKETQPSHGDQDKASVYSDVDEDEIEHHHIMKPHADRKPAPLSFCALIKLNAPEWKSISIGSVFSALTGIAMPVFMIIFGIVLGEMSKSNAETLMGSVKAVAFFCVVLGLAIGATNLIQTVSFGIAGAYLTERLRVHMFGHLMAQDIGFYDKDDNATGALCARLSSDAAYVRQATGQRIGVVLQSIGAVGGALIIAGLAEWRIALVALAFAPVLVVVVYYESKLAQVESFGNAEAVKNSTKIALEAVSAVRTVASLQREQRFVDQYVAQLTPALGPAKRSAHCRGIVSGLGRSIFNFINATTLTFGSLIVTEGAHYQKIFVATQSLQMAAVQVQNISTYYPDFQNGISAASRAVALLKTEPAIVNPTNPITPFTSSGDASFEAVEFRYPTRPSVKILRGLDLQFKHGETIALVGESGCGKSTVISLLQRYFDPEAGVVALSGISLTRLLLEDIRASFGLVSQEPVLFDRSVRDNISYGDNSRICTDEEIVEAATQANIHSFVQTLPEGYNTNVGSKGVQLSGGQKQRIAIARALVRKPKILLLDEATSALDTESEKVVQEALDRAQEGRTCVMIAHRLSTVRDADAICVVRGGRVAEKGTHQELLQAKGLYYELYSKGA